MISSETIMHRSEFLVLINIVMITHFVDLDYLINIIKSNEQNISDHSLVCEYLYYFPQLIINNPDYNDVNMLKIN